MSVEDFELLPADDEGSTPEADLDAAEQGALEDPFAVAEEGEPPVPFGVSWLYDFEAGRFVRHGVGPAQVSGKEALRMWVLMAVHVALGAHPAVFPDDFGMERPGDPIGSVSVQEFGSDHEQRLRDALLVHDRIVDVADYDSDYDSSTGILRFVFSVVTDEEDADAERFGPLSLDTVVVADA